MEAPENVRIPRRDEMSSATLEPESASPPSTAVDSEPKLPDASVLVDQVPARFKLPRSWAGWTLVLGLIYLTFSLKPIWHTDIWGHVSYGKLVWETCSLPETEPLLPLARGMPFVDTAWLSQLISYGVLRTWGLAGLQGLTGIAAVLACSLLISQCQAKTRSAVFTLAALSLFLWFEWYQLMVLRPQLFGLACFVALLGRLTGRPWSGDWFAVPALFLIWTNLHGSFPIGIALMLAFAAGRAVDLLRRTRSLSAWRHDAQLRRLILLTELAIAATLINPYGPWLYREVLSFGSNANLQSLTEWQPLDVRRWLGGSLLALLGALAVLYRLTPRRVQAWEPLVLIGLAVSAFWSARMLAWLAPVAAYLAALHAHAAWRAWRKETFTPVESPRAGVWTVVVIGLAWICFGYSPLGLKVIHGQDPKLSRAVSDYTPVGAVEYLKDHPPVGQVFNIYEWGDYLQWSGPPGLRIFVNSHAHEVPAEVWQHYLQVIHMSSGWQETLDRYGVNTVIVDRAIRDNLIKALKDDDRWRVGYEDRTATVFVRKQAI